LRVRSLMMVVAGALIALGVTGPALIAGATTSGSSLSAARSQSAAISASTPRTEAGVQAIPDGTKDVAARVSCGDQECGFNGHVDWNPASIKVYGIVWGSSGGGAEVYVSWYSVGVHKNKEAGSAPGLNGVGVNYYTLTPEPGYIEITVCGEQGGWHCGVPVDP
jgi:hypothetical protein